MNNSILKWLDRFKVVKEDGHVAYYDLLVDVSTGVEYFATNGSLCARLDQSGVPMLNENYVN